MRRQYRSFVVTMVVVSLCCGFIGCRSNGGSWYKLSSYSWHNPFKSKVFEDDDFGRYAEDNNGIRKPRDGQSPDLDLTPPTGGYSDRNQVVQNTNRSTNVNIPGSNVGGYPYNQSPPVAINNPPYQNQAASYQNPPATWQNPGVPQGQPYPQPNQNYNVPPGGAQVPNPQPYQQPYTPNTGNGYAASTGQYQQYDPSYGTTQGNGYASGYNTYSEEYRPGSRL